MYSQPAEEEKKEKVRKKVSYGRVTTDKGFARLDLVESAEIIEQQHFVLVVHSAGE